MNESKNTRLLETVERIENVVDDFHFLSTTVEHRRNKGRDTEEYEESLERKQKEMYELCKRYISVFEEVEAD